MTLPASFDAYKLDTPPSLEEARPCPDCDEPLDDDDTCPECGWAPKEKDWDSI